MLEFAEFGNLQEFLQENRADESYSSLANVSETLTAKDLTGFAQQVACGMEYISSLNVSLCRITMDQVKHLHPMYNPKYCFWNIGFIHVNHRMYYVDMNHYIMTHSLP